MKLPAALKWTLGVVAGLFVGAALAFVVVAALLDAGAFHGPMVRVAAAIAHHPLRIDGALRTHLLSFRPGIEAEGVVIGNPVWSPRGNAAEIARLEVGFELWWPWRGFAYREVHVQGARFRLVRDEDGRANWRRNGTLSAGHGLSPIRRLTLDDVRLELHDARRQLEFRGRLTSQDIVAGRGAPYLRLTARGNLNGRPVSAVMHGDALATTRRDRAYRFALAESSSGSVGTARGTFAQPFDFREMDVTFAAHGEDLADLYFLIGLSLPDTGAYRLEGKLARRDTRFAYSDIVATSGRSDLSGKVTVDTAPERTLIEAEVRSRLLRAADLGRRAAGRPTTQPEGLLLPVRALRLQTIRRRDAKVDLRVAELQLGPLVARDVRTKVSMARGVLDATTQGALDEGRVTAEIRFDATPAVPAMRIATSFSGLQLASVARAPRAPPAEGLLHGRVELEGRGRSVHEIAAGANGRASFVLPHGALRASLAELAGTDLNGLGLQLAKSDATTPVRCAVASFDVRAGTATTQSLLLDTDPVLLTGSGTVNLDSEMLDLTVKASPKHPRLRLRGPLHIGGTLADPSFRIDTRTTLLQGAAAVALGVLLTPFAAGLAFVDPGLAKDADCAALLR